MFPLLAIEETGSVYVAPDTQVHPDSVSHKVSPSSVRFAHDEVPWQVAP